MQVHTPGFGSVAIYTGCMAPKTAERVVQAARSVHDADWSAAVLPKVSPYRGPSGKVELVVSQSADPKRDGALLGKLKSLRLNAPYAVKPGKPILPKEMPALAEALAMGKGRFIGQAQGYDLFEIQRSKARR